LVLIQQQHDAQIPQALIAESRARDELQTLDLTEVGRIAEHVNVEKFGDVIVTGERVFLFERRL
jgi:hypothetical protein